MKPRCPHPPSSENMRINFSKTFPRESLRGKREKGMQNECYLKGTVSRDFLLLVFFMNQFPPRP